MSLKEWKISINLENLIFLFKKIRKIPKIKFIKIRNQTVKISFHNRRIIYKIEILFNNKELNKRFLSQLDNIYQQLRNFIELHQNKIIINLPISKIKWIRMIKWSKMIMVFMIKCYNSISIIMSSLNNNNRTKILHNLTSNKTSIKISIKTSIKTNKTLNNNANWQIILDFIQDKECKIARTRIRTTITLFLNTKIIINIKIL